MNSPGTAPLPTTEILGLPVQPNDAQADHTPDNQIILHDTARYTPMPDVGPRGGHDRRSLAVGRAAVRAALGRHTPKPAALFTQHYVDEASACNIQALANSPLSTFDSQGEPIPGAYQRLPHVPIRTTVTRRMTSQGPDGQVRVHVNYPMIAAVRKGVETGNIMDSLDNLVQIARKYQDGPIADTTQYTLRQRVTERLAPEGSKHADAVQKTYHKVMEAAYQEILNVPDGDPSDPASFSYVQDADGRILHDEAGNPYYSDWSDELNPDNIQGLYAELNKRMEEDGINAHERSGKFKVGDMSNYYNIIAAYLGVPDNDDERKAFGISNTKIPPSVKVKLRLLLAIADGQALASKDINKTVCFKLEDLCPNPPASTMPDAPLQRMHASARITAELYHQSIAENLDNQRRRLEENKRNEAQKAMQQTVDQNWVGVLRGIASLKADRITTRQLEDAVVTALNFTSEAQAMLGLAGIEASKLSETDKESIAVKARELAQPYTALYIERLEHEGLCKRPPQTNPTMHPLAIKRGVFEGRIDAIEEEEKRRAAQEVIEKEQTIALKYLAGDYDLELDVERGLPNPHGHADTDPLRPVSVQTLARVFAKKLGYYEKELKSGNHKKRSEALDEAAKHTQLLARTHFMALQRAGYIDDNGDLRQPEKVSAGIGPVRESLLHLKNGNGTAVTRQLIEQWKNNQYKLGYEEMLRYLAGEYRNDPNGSGGTNKNIAFTQVSTESVINSLLASGAQKLAWKTIGHDIRTIEGLERAMNQTERAELNKNIAAAQKAQNDALSAAEKPGSISVGGMIRQSDYENTVGKGAYGITRQEAWTLALTLNNLAESYMRRLHEQGVIMLKTNPATGQLAFDQPAQVILNHDQLITQADNYHKLSGQTPKKPTAKPTKRPRA